MNYLYHNFYSNFTAGIQAGDNNIVADLVKNEITNYIVMDTKLYVDMLNKVGIKASESMSDEELLDKTIAGLKNNDNMVRGLAFLMADTNGIINSGAGNKGTWTSNVEEISNGITAVAKKIKDENGYAASFKKDAMYRIENKARVQKNYGRTIYKQRKYMLAKVGGVLLLVAGVTYLIYRYRQGKAAANLAASALSPVNAMATALPAAGDGIAAAASVVPPLKAAA